MTVVYHNSKPVLVVDANEEFQFQLSYDFNPDTRSNLFYTATGMNLTDREKEILIANYQYKERLKRRDYPFTPDECFYHLRSGGQSENSTVTEYVDVKTPEEASNQYRALEMMEEFDKAMRMTPEEFAKKYMKVKSRR